MSSFNNTFIGQLALGVWTYDLNSPTNISPLSVSGYFISNIGKFDNLTSQCYGAFGYSGQNFPNGMSGDGAYNYDIVDFSNPSGNLLGDTEANILRNIYLITYYEGLIQSFSGPGLYVQGVNSQNLPVQSLKEGDSQITWANVAQIMSVYQKLLQDKRLELNYLVEAYNRNSQGSEIPRTLAFFNIIPGNNWVGNTY
jgi:hypothetical protein